MKKLTQLIVTISLLAAITTGCGRKADSTADGANQAPVIQNSGSDTMVNLAQRWAEVYATTDAGASIEVSGGGSGTGIAALINGTTDIANCSRAMKEEEIQKAKTNTGKDPKEYIMGYEALAVYVHKDCTLDNIKIDQLAGIYG